VFIHVITFPSPCVSSSSCDTGVHYTFPCVNMLYIIIAYRQEERGGGVQKISFTIKKAKGYLIYWLKR
jgi:hypothetical protein